MNRQKAILAILLVLLAVSVVVSFFRMPQQKTVASLKFAPGKPVATPSATVSTQPEEVRLRLDLLDQKNAPFKGYRRNIFKPIFHEEVRGIPLPPPPPPPKTTQQAPAVSSSAPAVPPAKAPELTPVQRDMATFTFLGFLKKGTQKTIFLSNNKEIFLARIGDRLAGKYDVTDITDEALLITPLDGGEIVIPLVENKPLAAPAKPGMSGAKK
jgi:hypothetical protein